MATSDRKSTAFVLTREGKSSIFKQNDGISLNLTRFALFKDNNNKLKDFLKSVDYDYTALENLTYDFFADDFTTTEYDHSLVAIPRMEDGKQVLCLNVDIFNKGDVEEDQTYDGIIYFCDAYNSTPEMLFNIAEEQNPKTIFAIQYFDTNKIVIQKDQDNRIKFVVQIRFSQNNYDVIDLAIPDAVDNGIRLYNDASSNLLLKSKTVGTNRSLAIGNNLSEVGSIVDVYADAGKNQISLMSLSSNELGPFVSSEVDVKFTENAFVIEGQNTNSIQLFSKGNDTSPAANSVFSFSNNNSINDASSGKFTFINSNDNAVEDGYNSTFISTDNTTSTGGNITFIGSDAIRNAGEKDTYIASNAITFNNTIIINEKDYVDPPKHNTFINSNSITADTLKNFVSIGGKSSTFTNIDNGFVIGHDLNVGSASRQLKDIVVLGKYNAPIETGDIFVLANGTSEKGNNAFKVNNSGEMTINDGINAAVISPTGIKYKDDEISYSTIIQIVNNQTTLTDMNNTLEEMKETIERIASNGLMNITFLLDVDNTFNVDEHVTEGKKQNNVLVSLYNPFENEVTITYKYRLKTALFNPETETLTVGNKQTIQLIYVDNDDYKGFVKVR